MLYKIARKFYWEMSHRLPQHDGLCKNIHGHSYSLLIEISGELADDGMVMDFYDLDKVIGPIINKLDHCFLCNENDDKMLKFLKDNEFKHYAIYGETTAENILNWILNQLKPGLKKRPNLRSVRLRLYETADTYAEIEDNI